jgi:hypothetical protein
MLPSGAHFFKTPGSGRLRRGEVFLLGFRAGLPVARVQDRLLSLAEKGKAGVTAPALQYHFRLGGGHYDDLDSSRFDLLRDDSSLLPLGTASVALEGCGVAPPWLLEFSLQQPGPPFHTAQNPAVYQALAPVSQLIALKPLIFA